VAVYRRSNRRRFVFVLLLLTSITLITLDMRGSSSGAIGSLRRGAHDVFAPIQSAADKVISPVGDFFGGITRYGHVKSENQRLKARLAELEAKGVQESEAQRQLQVLTANEHLTFAPDLKSVVARVVSTSPSNFQVTVELDKGTAAGIQKGMPVVSGAGLVGRVVEVSKERATVLLITDGESHVGVRFSGSGDTGIANGAGPSEPIAVGFVNAGTKVQPAEVVTTSGLQHAIFPPGIPVGKVRSAKPAADKLALDVTIDPVVDLSHLEFLKVLIWLPAPGP
jgi:rod shape-determining protein MreC